jgi:hypothetical protein
MPLVMIQANIKIGFYKERKSVLTNYTSDGRDSAEMIIDVNRYGDRNGLQSN